MGRARLLIVALVAAVIVLALGAAVAGYAITDAAHKAPKPSPTPALPSAYSAASRPPAAPGRSSTTPPAPATGIAAALGPLLSAAGIGPEVRAQVLDAATGHPLFARSPSTPVAPASTAKLLTAVAVLSVHAAGDRFATKVVRGPSGSVVLVGGGDPTLSGAAAGRASEYLEAGRMSDLAAALRRAGVRPTRIVVDDSLFTGPAVSPKWAPEDVPSDYASAITPAMVDGGRAAPDDAVRSSTPDVAAGRRLAVLLGRGSLPVTRGVAPAGAAVLATVRSAPVSTLVAEMLQASDNVIAECLARQVALAEHQPASFAGGATAIRGVLQRLGVDPGTGLSDGSGLAASDRVSSATLAAVLRLATVRPRLRYAVTGLPVAAWSGTLADRYLSGTSRAGAGVVRAKTGTLTGVSALAGLVRDRDGELLVFVFVADRAPDTAAAEAALDAVAARLAGCGCR
jgi:D-alanyl-D-alanine carboxypeptidase/D-alanyl-D-alanine-endopeptidase (penicillin-binding protein 4)